VFCFNLWDFKCIWESYFICIKKFEIRSEGFVSRQYTILEFCELVPRIETENRRKDVTTVRVPCEDLIRTTVAHSVAYIDHGIGVVLGFGAVQLRRSMPTFRRHILSPSSGLKWQSPPLPIFVTSALKTETVWISETFASTYKTIRRQNRKQNQHRTNLRLDFKSHTV
jgi:hypothetical protein